MGFPADLIRVPTGVIDPYGAFEQSQFLGRACRLAIPGVGVSPVRLRSPGQWADVAFEAWAPPIPAASPAEVCEALWVAIYDLCQQHGQPDLAGLARAACRRVDGDFVLMGRDQNRSWVSIYQDGSHPLP